MTLPPVYQSRDGAQNASSHSHEQTRTEPGPVALAATGGGNFGYGTPVVTARVRSALSGAAFHCAFFGGLAAAVAGCGEVATDEPVDCPLLCSRYFECVEPIDVAGCISTCEHHASISRVFALAAVSCKHCIDGKGCDEVSACWDTCPVRLPP